MQIGQTFTASQGTFPEAPDTLRHKVNVKLNAEPTLSGASTFGIAPEPTTVLDQPFNTVELVGKPLSIGHFVSVEQIGTPTSAIKTFTCSPYVLINENDLNPDDDHLIRGTDYQEVLTNFPFSSQFLTGLLLDLTTLFPEVNGQRKTETVKKEIIDRIGFVARQNGGGSAVN